MSDFNVRSDSVDVEQIMRQIRARVREKRGSDYTEAELQQLASVKLEKFLDPRGVRSDLVEAFRKHHTVAEAPPNFEFEDTTLYESHRGFIRFMRKLLHPILKLFFNPDKITAALHIQSKVNTEYHRQLRQRDAMDPLFYEVIHNLVLEVTRVGIELQNLKMRVESLSSRMDFDERRARSLESVVEYKQDRQPRGDRGDRQDRQRQPHQQQGASQGQRSYASSVTAPAAPAAPAATAPTADVAAGQPADGAAGSAPAAVNAPGNGGAQGQGGPRADGERRRRRRRRRRRPGQTMADQGGNGGANGAAMGAGATYAAANDADGDADAGGADDGGDDGPDDGADDQ